MGVRVIEPHERHGLHYHALLNVRVPIEFVQRIGKRYGFGRVHVKRCDIGAAHYLIPYVGKASFLSSGIRRWSTVGGFVGVKCKDVIIETDFSRNMATFTGGRKVGYNVSSQIWRYTQFFGPVKHFPREFSRYCYELCSERPSPAELLKLRMDIPDKYQRCTWHLKDLPFKAGSRQYVLHCPNSPHYKRYHVPVLSDKVIAEVTQRYPAGK